MRKYSKTKVIRISEIQHQTLQKMRSMGIDVGIFIRDSISEKIEREKHIILKPKKEFCPF
jgi:hypothetical protein